MLSDRAQQFLATLERRPWIPTREVEAIIKSQGFPIFESWLEFHDAYAGYVEKFQNDWAVWGLVHDNPYWLSPRKADVDRESFEETWYVTCADTHPSHQYRLDNSGEFLNGPAASFDIRIERQALDWYIATKGSYRSLSFDELKGQELENAFTTQISEHLVPEASDQFLRYYLSGKFLLIERVEDGKFCTAYELS